MGPTNNIVYLLQHLSAVIGRQADDVLREQLGIGFSQYKILMVLEWNPRVQQKTIADSLGQTEASISRQIKLLESKGLIITKQDEQNRRKHISTPTLRGMQITEAATNNMRRSFGTQYAAMGDNNLAELFSGMQALHKIVCKSGKLGACDHPLGL